MEFNELFERMDRVDPLAEQDMKERFIHALLESADADAVGSPMHYNGPCGEAPTAEQIQHVREMSWEQIAEALYKVLDDIDTASDMFKDDYKAFQDYVMDRQQRKNQFLTSDGYELVKIGELDECVCHVYEFSDIELLEFYRVMDKSYHLYGASHQLPIDKQEVVEELYRRGLDVSGAKLDEAAIADEEFIKNRWDSAKLGHRVAWIMKGKWVTHAGEITRSGEKFAQSKWDDLSPAVQNVVKKLIAKDYDRQLSSQDESILATFDELKHIGESQGWEKGDCFYLQDEKYKIVSFIDDGKTVVARNLSTDKLEEIPITKEFEESVKKTIGEATLTPSQEKALKKFESGKEYSAYDLQTSLATLNALVTKGYLSSKHGLGAMAFPASSIMFKLKKEQGTDEKKTTRAQACRSDFKAIEYNRQFESTDSDGLVADDEPKKPEGFADVQKTADKLKKKADKVAKQTAKDIRKDVKEDIERIVNAAIRTASGKVYTGDNHSAIAQDMKQKGVWPPKGADSQGFVTSTGRFVNRQESTEVARKARQVRDDALAGYLIHDFSVYRNESKGILKVVGEDLVVETRKLLRVLGEGREPCPLNSHARTELEKAGLFDEDSDYNGMLGDAVMKLMDAFSGQGHSGFSAMLTLDLFNRVAKYEALTELTDDPDEWNDISEYQGGHPSWQSTRNPSAFSTDGGKYYYNLDDPAFKCVDEDGTTYTTNTPETWAMATIHRSKPMVEARGVDAADWWKGKPPDDDDDGILGNPGAEAFRDLPDDPDDDEEADPRFYKKADHDTWLAYGYPDVESHFLPQGSIRTVCGLKVYGEHYEDKAEDFPVCPVCIKHVESGDSDIPSAEELDKTLKFDSYESKVDERGGRGGGFGSGWGGGLKPSKYNDPDVQDFMDSWNGRDIIKSVQQYFVDTDYQGNKSKFVKELGIRLGGGDRIELEDLKRKLDTNETKVDETKYEYQNVDPDEVADLEAQGWKKGSFNKSTGQIQMYRGQDTAPGEWKRSDKAKAGESTKRKRVVVNRRPPYTRRPLSYQSKEMEPKSDKECAQAAKRAHRPWSAKDRQSFINTGAVADESKVKEDIDASDKAQSLYQDVPAVEFKGPGYYVDISTTMHRKGERLISSKPKYIAGPFATKGEAAAEVKRIRGKNQFKGPGLIVGTAYREVQEAEESDYEKRLRAFWSPTV